MENAVIIKADGSIEPVRIEEWMEEKLAAAIEAEGVSRVWSHKLVSFGMSCKLAIMGYQDSRAAEKALPVNPLAEKLTQTAVQGSFLLTYWDSFRMSCGAMEPQEVERILEELKNTLV